MKLFELFATLSLDSKEFEDGVEDAKKKAEGLGESVEKSVTAKTVAMGHAMYDMATTAARALWGLGQEAISAAAEIEAENAAFSSTFGEMADDANNAFREISNDTNILAGRLRTVGMQAFSQFKGAGMDASKALSMMDAYIRLAADGAARYNISLEDADARIRSFLRGNVEAGDAIGLHTSALQRDTKAMELYNLKWEKLNEEQRQLVMFNVADEIYKINGAFGMAQAEAYEYANVVGNFQRAWREALATMGGPVLQKITPAIQKLTEFMQSNPEMLEKLGNVFGDLAGLAVDSLIGGMEWLSENGETVLATFNNLLNTINNIIAALSGNYHTNVTADVKMDVTSSVSSATGNAALGGLAGEVVQSSMMADSPAGSAGQAIGGWLASLFGHGSRAVGMENVPYDGLAYLHKGEGILTKAENAERLQNVNRMDVSQIGPVVADAVREGMQGVSVHMSGEKVGDLVTDRVSRNMAQAAWEERYSV